MPRLRSRLAGAAVALAALPLAVATPGPAIGDAMYGVFFEDINYAADGGLYAELVRNRSFEFQPADNRSFTGLTGWTPTVAGSATTVDDADRLNERNRTYLKLAAGGG